MVNKTSHLTQFKILWEAAVEDKKKFFEAYLVRPDIAYAYLYRYKASIDCFGPFKCDCLMVTSGPLY
jgi:hypothetical protein